MGWIHEVGKFPTFSNAFINFLYALLASHFIEFCSYQLQEKILSEDELVEMPFCNLVETVHNKWLQASGNKGGNLYVASVDDYI